MIDPALASFLQEGLGIHLGTRDDRLQPSGARAVAVAVEPDGRHVIAYLAAIASTRLMPNLEANGQATLLFARPTDDRACQVKGVFTGHRPAGDEERRFMDAQWDRFLKNLELVGIPRATTRGWVRWPAVAIRIRATALFDQTPGARAGAPLT